MNCDRLALSRLLDGELSPMEAARVRYHLGGCAACEAQLEEWIHLSIRGRPRPAPTPSTASSEWILVAISLFAFAAAWLFSLVWLGR